MKRIAFFGIMALFCVDAVAQQPAEIVLKDNINTLSGVVNVKKINKQTVWTMPNTENSWIKDTVVLYDYPTVNGDSLYRDKNSVIYFNKKKMSYLLVQNKLVNQGDETVLHCYFPMSADYVENLWLASDETAIVDMETGIQYRAKRTFPDGCMRKHISIKAQNNADGDVVDFQIFFPKLPETTKNVAIYGVPTWNMRGSQFQLDNRRIIGEMSNRYDDAPQIKRARLIKEEKDYNKDKHDTWAEYADVHLIKPVADGTMALWLTKDATYLAVACEQNWNREYMGFEPQTQLLVDNNKELFLKNVIGLPTEHIFWINGYSGDFFAYVLVFDPMPLDASTITLVVPDGEPFRIWGASWRGKTIRDINVNELRANQSLFEYHPRVIKE